MAPNEIENILSAQIPAYSRAAEITAGLYDRGVAPHDESKQ